LFDWLKLRLFVLLPVRFLGGVTGVVYPAFFEHNVQMQTLVGIEVAAGTLTRYKTTYSHVGNFIKWKYKKNDIDVGDWNYEFITQLLFWLCPYRKEIGLFASNKIYVSLAGMY
jgi:hypothetical protein